MVRNDLELLSEEEFVSIIEKSEDEIRKYIKEKILDDFIATYIYINYKNNSLWNESLFRIARSGLESLIQFDIDDSNINNVKQILEDRYKLKITNEDNLEIMEI